MSISEIIDCATEVAKWSGIGLGAYLAALVGISEIPRFYSKKISSQEDLERVTREEIEKLGMDNKKVHSLFRKHSEGRSCRLSDGIYLIVTGGATSNRAVVRHELYHIHKGHCDEISSSKSIKGVLDYLFRKEPQALVYGAFGIKL